jgi:hypothetical protein
MTKSTKTLFILLVVCVIAQMNAHAQVSFGKPEKINDNWLFLLADDPGAKNRDFDDSKWRKLDLPHDWSVEVLASPTLASCTGYLPGGIGWYRKHVSISEAKKGEKIYLYFEGVYNRSEVYVNGNRVGGRPNGYIPFLCDITSFVQFGSENVIAVRVDHSQSADSRWYTGSGIYRNVFLVTANPVHIAQWGVFCQATNVSGNEASLNVQVEINNTSGAEAKLEIRCSLLDAEGKAVAKATSRLLAKSGEKSSVKSDLKVKTPVLWGLQNPYLYQLKTEVSQNGQVIDQCTTPVGIRTIQYDADKGFALNGEWLKMKGVCIHHDAGCLGAAVPVKVWERRLKNLREIGCNAIRMSHNPQSPELYDLCDQMGFLVMDEAFDEWKFPKKKWLTGWNKGTPGFEGTADFFEEWSERDLADMVLCNRNHPSIVMWSIGNEIDYPNDPFSHPVLDHGTINQPVYGGYLPNNPPAKILGDIARRLATTVRRLDQLRPVTAALAGVIMSNETEYPGALDVVGYNYTEDRYEMDHQKYPDRVIYGSENGQSMGAWKSVRDREHIFAQFLWIGIDYLGEAHEWPSRGSQSGLLDLAGFRKPRGWFRYALWSDKPACSLGTYPTPENPKNLSIDAWPIWNYQPGEKIRVVCYTNCQKAKLLLNGKRVGEMKDYDDETGMVFWDIPYAAGKLEVIGFNNGQEAGRFQIQSSERPAVITASTGDKTLDKAKDLAQIEIQVTDENGVPVMLSDDEITCTIEGPAKLLGLESGNNKDMGNYTDKVQRAYHGRLLAYVQTTGEVGKVKVSFTAPWLKPAEIIIDVK